MILYGKDRGSREATYRHLDYPVLLGNIYARYMWLVHWPIHVLSSNGPVCQHFAAWDIGDVAIQSCMTACGIYSICNQPHPAPSLRT
jgi:bacteriorhodopsin